MWVIPSFGGILADASERVIWSLKSFTNYQKPKTWESNSPAPAQELLCTRRALPYRCTDPDRTEVPDVGYHDDEDDGDDEDDEDDDFDNEDCEYHEDGNNDEYDDEHVGDADANANADEYDVADEYDEHDEYADGDEIYFEALGSIALGAVAVVLASSKILWSLLSWCRQNLHIFYCCLLFVYCLWYSLSWSWWQPACSARQSRKHNLWGNHCSRSSAWWLLMIFYHGCWIFHFGDWC